MNGINPSSCCRCTLLGSTLFLPYRVDPFVCSFILLAIGLVRFVKSPKDKIIHGVLQTTIEATNKIHNTRVDLISPFDMFAGVCWALGKVNISVSRQLVHRKDRNTQAS